MNGHARDLSWEELLDGIIGGGNDGGIDALYVFYNGILLASDTLAPESRGVAQFDLYIIQAKRTAGFSELAIERLRSSLTDLLNFDHHLKEMTDRYSEDLVSIIGRFKDCYLANAGNFPAVTLDLFYGSRGFDIHPNVQRKSLELEGVLGGLFSGGTCKFNFITPSELIAMARRQRPTTLNLQVREVMATSTGGWISLVGLDAYSSFVSTDGGELRGAIFESNVRDYEPNTKINASIHSTLENSEGDDFWWLNNGVTIVATRAGQSGKALTLEYPQVVNGLQTTREIHRYVRQRHNEGVMLDENDDRTVLVRIVVPPTDASRDRIIRATNSQTPIPSVALRATDKIQRDIEEYFLQNGFFYERRKNHYQNEAKPIARIVTIPYLAEAVMAAVLHEPHLGKPRLGGGFLRNDEVYNRIFDADTPLSIFLQSVRLVQAVEKRMRAGAEQARLAQSQNESYESVDRRDRRESMRYMLPTAMVVAIAAGSLEDLDTDHVSIDLIDASEDLCAVVDGSRRWSGKGGADARYASALLKAIPNANLPDRS